MMMIEQCVMCARANERKLCASNEWMVSILNFMFWALCMMHTRDALNYWPGVNLLKRCSPKPKQKFYTHTKQSTHVRFPIFLCLLQILCIYKMSQVRNSWLWAASRLIWDNNVSESIVNCVVIANFQLKRRKSSDCLLAVWIECDWFLYKTENTL